MLSWRQLRSCSRRRCRLAQEAAPAGPTPAETTSTEAGPRRPDIARRHRRPPSRAKPKHARPCATPSAGTRRRPTPPPPRALQHRTREAETRNDRARQERSPRRPGRRSRRPQRREPSSSSRRRQPAAAPAPLAAAPAPQRRSGDSAGPVRSSDSGHDHADGGADPRRRRSRSPPARALRRRDGGRRRSSVSGPAAAVGDHVAADGRAGGTGRVRARPRQAIPGKNARSARPARGRPRRVPLSRDCEQARAISALRSGSRPCPVGGAGSHRSARPRISIRRVETRPPPESKAVKKHPVAEVRPTVPFGSSGQGAANHSFNRSTGATWSSRILVLAAAALARAAAVPLRPLAPAEHDSARRDRSSSPARPG